MTTPSVPLLSEWEFEQLLSQYRSRIIRSIESHLMRDPRNTQDDVADVLQNVSINLWRSLKKVGIHHGRDIWTYIAKTVDVQCKAHYHSYQKRVREHQVPMERILDTNGEPADETDYLEEKDVQKVLLELPVKYRRILIEYYVEKWDQKELAESRGISQQRVSDQLQRACRAFQKKWYECTGSPVRDGGTWHVKLVRRPHDSV